MSLGSKVMNRRGFLQAGAMGALTSPRLLAGLSGHVSALAIGSNIESGRATPRSLLSQYSPEDERQRLQNIAFANVQSMDACASIS